MSEDVATPTEAAAVKSISAPADVYERILDKARARDTSMRTIADEAVNAALDAAGAPPAPPTDVIPLARVRRYRGRGALGPRARTIAARALTRRELLAGAITYPPVDDVRPTTRSDCEYGINDARPCPWVSCKFHLYLDVNPDTGSIKINYPDLEPWDLKESCALDVAARGGMTLEDVGILTNLTRERIRQVETRGLLKLKMASPSPDEVGAALLRRRGQ